MNSVINLDSFQERFVSGLIFSMLEGLEDGQSILFRSKAPFDEFRAEILSAGLTEIVLGRSQKVDSQWELLMSKNILSALSKV